MDLLDGLNDAQQQAVTHGDGPLMIVAGAGTGKTTVITKRIAWLIQEGKARQDEILALTFTDKAANEMEERVDKLLPIGYLDLWISTFHGFCERVLRQHGLDIGLPNGFTLLNDVDAWMLMRRTLDRFSLDYYKPRGNPTKFLETMLGHFSRAKDEGITPDIYDDAVTALELAVVGSDPLISGAATSDERGLEIKKWRELANAYRVYQQVLLEHNALDFGDLISYTLELFRTRPNVLKEYRDTFRYIVVDEFQDTNTAQYELVKLLASEKNNITIVGDDDQAIYRFRGAALANIFRFRSDYPKTAKIVLTHNYRSGSEILDRSYALIQYNNPHRLEASEQLHKRLRSQTSEKGFVERIHAATIEDEVESVTSAIRELKKNGSAWSDIAILVRANDSADPFLLDLERAGIPYRFLALSGLYTKPIIVDALAYMRTIDDIHDSTSIYRIVSHPRLGLSSVDIAHIGLHAKKRGVSWREALENATMLRDVSMEGRKRAHEIIMLLDALLAKAKRMPVQELFVEVVKQTGLLADVQRLPEREQRAEFALLQTFLNRLRKFSETNVDRTLHTFLEEFAHERAAGESGGLPVDGEEGPDVVSVMTVHGAKGLEFSYVFVVNCVEQRFPSQSRGAGLTFPPGLMKEEEWTNEEHYREERRLFYVAMTRAKQGLFLLSADDYGGTRKKKPSRFLEEAGFALPSSSNVTSSDVLRGALTDVPSKTIAHTTQPYKLPERLSFTQITAFAKCPLQYKYAHILHVPVFGRYQMSFGKSMHNTLQRFMGFLLPQPTPPQTTLFAIPHEPRMATIPSQHELLTMLDECWIDEWYPNEETKKQYRDSGREALRVFYAKVLEEKPQPAFLEKGFTLKIDDICVRGRIDRMDTIDDGIEIIDYKTGEPKTEEKLTWDDRRQLVLYAMAVEQCFDPPLNAKKLTYYYLESNTTVSFTPSEKDKQRLIDDIRSFMSAITESDFAPTPGFHCRWCDFNTICEHAAI